MFSCSQLHQVSQMVLVPQDKIVSYQKLLGNSLPSDYYPLYCKRFQGTPTTGWAKGPWSSLSVFFFFSSMPQGMRDTSSPTRVQTYTPCNGSGKCGLPTTGLPEKTPFGSVFTPFNLPNQWLKHLLVTFLTAISVFGLLDFFKLNRADSRPFTLRGSGRGPFSLPSLG